VLYSTFVLFILRVPVRWFIGHWPARISVHNLVKLVQQVVRCLQEAAKTSPVQQGRQYRAHAKSSSSDSSQSPPRQRARKFCHCFVTASVLSCLL